MLTPTLLARLAGDGVVGLGGGGVVADVVKLHTSPAVVPELDFASTLQKYFVLAASPPGGLYVIPVRFVQVGELGSVVPTYKS